MHRISDYHSEMLEWLLHKVRRNEKQTNYSDIKPVEYEIEDNSDIVLSYGEDLTERPSLYREDGYNLLPDRGHKIVNANIKLKDSTSFITSIHGSWYLIKNRNDWVVYATVATDPLNSSKVLRSGFVRLDRGKVEYRDWSKDVREYGLIEEDIEKHHAKETENAQSSIENAYKLIRNGGNIKQTRIILHN